MRSSWSGHIEFGLITVPVKMYSATNSDSDMSFTQVNKNTGQRVTQKRVDLSTGAEVPFADIMKGVEVGEDQYVMIDPSEIDDLAPVSSKVIKVEHFVDAGEVPMLLADKSYYIGPDKKANRGFNLLLNAMEGTGTVAIGKVTMRGQEYLFCIQPHENVLLATSLKWADDVKTHMLVPMHDCPPGNPPEVAVAEQLIGTMTTKFDHTNYVNEYKRELRKLVDSKVAGVPLLATAKVEDESPREVSDLMALLNASVAKSAADKAITEAGSVHSQ